MFVLQVVKMLIVVVTIFALLWLPHRGLLVYNTVASLNQTPLQMDLWYLMFAKTCIYINRSANVSHLFLCLNIFSGNNITHLAR